MRIYIDESGTFVPESAPTRWCCEAALMIPDRVANDLFQRFVEIRAAWTREPELKGSSLSDEQTATILRLLGQYDVVAEVAALDVGHHSLAQVERFRQRQAAAMVASLTPAHSAASREWAQNLRKGWLRLSPQLVLQAHSIVSVVENVIRRGINYYAQRMPEELGRFQWTFDPKDLKPTPFEEAWRDAIFPFLQDRSMKEPFPFVEGFDYSAFERLQGPIPDYLQSRVPSTSHRAIDLRDLFRDITFPDSKADAGLQLVDILAGACTKALNQRLPATVFRLLGPLMIQGTNGGPSLHCVVFGQGPRAEPTAYQKYVLTAITNRSKRMIA